MAKGLWTHEDISRMTDTVAEVRPEMNETFTVEQGIRAIVAAFRIETRGEK